MTRLILLPGLASDATLWQAQLAALPARWDTQVTDVHSRFADIQSMAAALLDEYTGDLVLCGTSMGCVIAMEAVRQAPHRIRGLALLAANARAEIKEMRVLREAAIVKFDQGRLLEVLLPNLPMAFHPDHVKNPALVETYLEFTLRAGGEQLSRQNRALMERPDARPHLPGFTCPTLVMCGEADQLTPPAGSREIAQLVPGAKLVMIERCGHMLTMEQPARVNEELLAWLQTLD